ncbi:MAG: WbuC family cupin fold metalloprotein [Bernardetiaceae bacterium]|jgi:cupin fold WbuC family metalloprotein|nr:WbuC family cupin fold metalloprotein [Bernardetiaceae bacterium]
MLKINQELLNNLVAKAQTAPRQRMNHNFHREAADPMNRMLNAMQPGTYVAPHKHQQPDKREAFIILQGKLLVVEFTETGQVTQWLVLSRETGEYGVEIPPRTYHTLVALENGTVVYELKDGPYDPTTDKIFAPWAPAEGAPGTDEYLAGLLRLTGQTVASAPAAEK